MVCPRYRFADGTDVTVIPWFLIPGRPYPIQVYLHACGIYSSNPEMGQRAAAKATRAKFKLEKFSHSTVSRSFRALEVKMKQCLEQRFGKEIVAAGTEGSYIVSAAAKEKAKSEDASETGRRFPTVAETGERRKEMAAFLGEYLDACEEESVESAGHRFVEGWHKRNQQLLR